MRKILTTFFFLTIYFISNAQSDFRDGYIITLNRDTIYGTIDFRSDINNTKRCTFKDKSYNIKEYKPKDIVSYRFINGKYYISKFVKRKDNTLPLFVEYLVKGEKNLYFFKDDLGSHYLLDFKDDTLTEIPYYEKNINKDGINYIYESKSHLAYLETYFSNCPSLFKEIEQIKKPDFDNLILLTKKYHHLTCGDSGCIVYYKPKPLIKIAVEPQFGTLNVIGTGSNSDKNLSQMGGLIYLWLPRSNERLYLRTGILYSKYTGNKNCTIFKVPFQFEYVFPYRVIKPKFDLGINYYSIDFPSLGYNKTLTLATSVGVLIKMIKFMYLDLSFDSDILELNYDTKIPISYSFITGIYFTF